MSEIRSYRDLEVWKTGIEIARAAYLVTKLLPRDEVFALTSQIRRAATSIPANIAEGHGRDTTGDFIRGLRIAQGSLKEVESHLEVCLAVGLLTTEQVNTLTALCDREGKMVQSLIRSLQEGS
jgi:four helix bundle protein